MKKIPHPVRWRIDFHVTRLKEHARALGGVERARGKGHILALEIQDRKESIMHSFAVLSEIHAMAVKHAATREFKEVLTTLGLPDFVAYGFPRSGVPSWVSQTREET